MSIKLTKPFKIRAVVASSITIGVIIAGIVATRMEKDVSGPLTIITLIALFGLDLLVSEYYARDPEELVDEIKPMIEASATASNLAKDAVKDTLYRMESLVEFSSADVREDLRKFRQLFHHYHLTKNDKNQIIWTYKRLDFCHAPIAGRLITYARIVVMDKNDDQEPEYRFEARVRGHDLVIHIRRDTRDTGVPDVSIEVFPRAVSKEPPYFGMKLLTTICDEPLSSISILRRNPIDPQASEGPVLNWAAAAELQAEWDRNSRIQRLPHASAVNTKRTQEFDEFFGRDTQFTESNAPRGTIVLQADSLTGLLRNWGNLDDQAKIRGTDRPFKARRWINACDANGAQAIVELFQSHDKDAPKLTLRERDSRDTEYTPLEIVMGGFTEKIRTELKEIGKGWMHLSDLDGAGEALDSGDTLFLHEELIPPDQRFKSFLKTGVNVGNLVSLLPSEWNGADYMKRWLNKLEHPGSDDVVNDYAMILRDTRDDPFNVKFYLTGFTEVGTQAAGYYLERHWQSLWAQHTKGKRGRFLAIIAGPSDPYRLKDNLWEAVLTITSQTLEEKGISCVWTKHKEA